MTSNASGERVGEPREPRAGDRLTRRQHADDARSRRRRRGLHGRLDGHDRNGPRLSQQVDGEARRGVAGDHDGLGALRHEEVDDGRRALADDLDRLVAVRGMAGIGHVDQVLARQLAADFAQQRESADAGVEDADGFGAHGALWSKGVVGPPGIEPGTP